MCRRTLQWFIGVGTVNPYPPYELTWNAATHAEVGRVGGAAEDGFIGPAVGRPRSLFPLLYPEIRSSSAHRTVPSNKTSPIFSLRYDLKSYSGPATVGRSHLSYI
jgi:hypothetical protein